MESDRASVRARRPAANSEAPDLPRRAPTSDALARRHMGLERLSRVARRQFGVVSTHQVQAAGLSRDSLATLVHSQVLVRRFRGVYAFRGTPDSREARWLAAQFAIGRRAVLSHQTAAAIHGLDLGVTDGAVHVIVPRRSRQVPAGIVVHESPHLQVATVTRNGVLRVTSVPRTLCDVAGGVEGSDRMRRVVAAAVRSGETEIGELRREIARRRTFPGSALLRRVVAELSALEPMARGELESLSLRVTSAAGVAPTKMDHRGTDADGRTRFLDAVWLPAWIDAELDSPRFHGTLVDWHDDQRRENALSLVGYGPCLRFSWWDLQHHAPLVADTVRRALAAAAGADGNP